jgi:hypothetical protein
MVCNVSLRGMVWLYKIALTTVYSLYENLLVMMIVCCFLININKIYNF